MALSILPQKAALKKAAPHKFKATELIVTLSVQAPGAIISRHLFERVLTLPDRVIDLVWEILVLLSFLGLTWRSLTSSLAADGRAGLTYLAELVMVPVVRYAFISQTFAVG